MIFIEQRALFDGYLMSIRFGHRRATFGWGIQIKDSSILRFGLFPGFSQAEDARHVLPARAQSAPVVVGLHELAVALDGNVPDTVY